MEKLYKAYFKTIFKNGWWGDAYPSSYPPGHKLQKPLKKSLAYFSHLAPLVFFFFLLKGRVKKGWVGMAQCPHKYASASRSLRVEACKRIISSFKKG